MNAARVRRRAPPRGELICPTPERVLKAGGWYQRTPDGYQRIIQSTLDRMHARRQLNPDADLNQILFEAGDRWRGDWYSSGLSGLAGVDYDRVGGGAAEPAYARPRGHYAAEKRIRWREARNAMSPDERMVVGCVVLDETSIVEAGRIVTKDMASGYRCRVVATELLRDGLRSLARHYGLGK